MKVGRRVEENCPCALQDVSLTQLNGALENRANQKPSSLNKTSQVAVNNICH